MSLFNVQISDISRSFNALLIVTGNVTWMYKWVRVLWYPGNPGKGNVFAVVFNPNCHETLVAGIVVRCVWRVIEIFFQSVCFVHPYRQP